MAALLDHFTKEELVCHEISILPSPRPCDLNNGVLPVFDRRNWSTSPVPLTSQAYDLLMPSLRLATLLTLSAGSLRFYEALLHSPRWTVQSWAGEGGVPPRMSFRALPATHRSQLLSLRNLGDMAVEVNGLTSYISCALIDGEPHETCMHGTTGRRHNVAVRDKCTGFCVGTGSTISLSSDTVDMLALLAAKCSPAVAITNLGATRHELDAAACQLLRLQFHCAVTLAHELVHAVNHTVDLDFNEPYFENDRLAELGCAWEQAVFGGRPQMVRGSDARHPLVFAKWSDAWRSEYAPWSGRRPPKKTHMFYWVGMRYVQNILSADWWDRLEKERVTDESALRIPKRLGSPLKGDGPSGNPRKEGSVVGECLTDWDHSAKESGAEDEDVDIVELDHAWWAKYEEESYVESDEEAEDDLTRAMIDDFENTIVV